MVSSRLYGGGSRGLFAVSTVALGFTLCLFDSSTAAETARFLRGDGNGDAKVSFADIMTIARYLHRPDRRPPCFDGADFDDSGSVDVTDLARLANYIFLIHGTSPQPPQPYPAFGVDPTEDDLDCQASQAAPEAEGAAAGVLPAQRDEETTCSPHLFDRDSGVVDMSEFRHGQLIDFILFGRSCIYGFPGQEIRVPVGVFNARGLDGFTLSVHAPPETISLDRFDFAGTALDEYTPDLVYNTTRWIEEGYLAASVFMDFEEPFFGKVFPMSWPMPRHVADLVFSISPDAMQGDVLDIRFETSPGVNPLSPPIGNEFSVEGRSVAPRDNEFGLHIAIAPPDRLFIRGDANRDLAVSISDVIRTLEFLFMGDGTECLAPLDSNSDGRVNLTDAVFLANYLFLAGPTPERPFPHPVVFSAEMPLAEGCPTG